MYKLMKSIDSFSFNGIHRLFDNAFIPINQINTDYANFKNEILTDQAELQDADGVTMSPDAAKQFVATLP